MIKPEEMGHPSTTSTSMGCTNLMSGMEYCLAKVISIKQESAPELRRIQISSMEERRKEASSLKDCLDDVGDRADGFVKAARCKPSTATGFDRFPSFGQHQL